jgi:hypothetical protein
MSTPNAVDLDLASFVILINGTSYGMDEHELTPEDIKRIAKAPEGDEVFHLFNLSGKRSKQKMISHASAYAHDLDEFVICPAIGGSG